MELSVQRSHQQRGLRAAGRGPDPEPRSPAPGLRMPRAMFPDGDRADGCVCVLFPRWDRAQVPPSSHSCGPSLVPGWRAVPSHSRGLVVGPASSGCDSRHLSHSDVGGLRLQDPLGSLSRHPFQHGNFAFAPRTILSHPPELTFCQVRLEAYRQVC